MAAAQGITAAQIGPLLERAVAARLQARPAPGSSSSPGSPGSGAPADALLVSKPVGESGSSIESLNLNNSFLRMFMVESSHRPAQVREAGGGHRLLSQDIKLSVAVTANGTPVAVGGRTVTQSRGDDGSRRTMQELAYVSHLRRLVTSSAGLLTGAGVATAPLVARNGDSLLDAQRTVEDRRLLLGSAPTPATGLLRSLTPGALSAMAGELGRLSGALGRLDAAFGALGRAGTFSAAKVSSSSPVYVAAEVDGHAAPGTHQVEVVRVARGHSIQSDETADGALGLSGSFTINGSVVTVAAGDALVDLATKINRGEDANGNGALDAGEDADGNFRLDGGTAVHGVRAGFYADRLTLTSIDSLAGNMVFDDPDGILEAVGLLERDPAGRTVARNELSAPQDAVVRVDGAEFRSWDNRFADAVPGVTLAVAGEPGRTVTVTVERSTDDAAAALRTALEGFNAAIREFNGALTSAGGILSRDPAATRVRQDLVRALVAPVGGLASDLDEAGDAGVARAGRSRAVFSEAQLASAARNERAGTSRQNPLRPAEDPATVYNALDELGIVAEDDDTFELDEERFVAVLAERPAGVADLFARARDGIAARVLGRVEAAAGEGGLLAMRQAALSALAESSPGPSLAGAFAPDLRRELLTSLSQVG